MESFHQRLAKYLREKDLENANMVVLRELADCLMSERDNFLTILRESGISVADDETDVSLIDKFIRNAPTNKRLLLGASFCINHRNKVMNFDGEAEISDVGVKNTYGVMKSYFIGNPYDEDHSNWIGAVVGVAKDLLGGLGKKKKGGDSQKKAQEEEAKKKRKTMLIVGGVSVAVLLVVIVIVARRRS